MWQKRPMYAAKEAYAEPPERMGPGAHAHMLYMYVYSVRTITTHMYIQLLPSRRYYCHARCSEGTL